MHFVNGASQHFTSAAGVIAVPHGATQPPPEMLSSGSAAASAWPVELITHIAAATPRATHPATMPIEVSGGSRAMAAAVVMALSLVLSLAAVAEILAGLATAWLVVRWHARLTAGRGGRWIGVTPPPGPVDPAAALALWRVLAGALHRAPWRPVAGPARVSAEWWADPTGVLRAGIWVPRAVDADQLAAALGRVWPGARTHVGPGPTWHRPGRRLATGAVTLTPVGYTSGHGHWAPLIDPTRTARGATGRRIHTGGEADPLRALLAGLAEFTTGRGTVAVVQMVAEPIRPPGLTPPWRLTTGDQDDTTRTRAGTGATTAAVAGWLLAALAHAVLRVLPLLAGHALLAVIDALSPSRARPTSRPAASAGPTGAGQDAGRAAIRAKQAQAPHLAISVRLALTADSPDTSHGRRATGADPEQLLRARAARIGAGLDVATPSAGWRIRPMRLAVVDRLTSRMPAFRPHRVTLAEAAALWHVPADPIRWGMPASPARVMAPGNALPRLPRPTPPGSALTRGPR